jgi:hypothetical protein
MVLMRRQIGKQCEIANMYRHLVLEDFASMAPSVQRLFARLIEIPGGGQPIATLRFTITYKGMDPANWQSSKLVLPKDRPEFLNKIGEYIKQQAGI